MSFRYEAAPTTGSLVQGELLADVWEHQPLHAPIEIQEELLAFRSIRHEVTLILNPYCDLFWDFAGVRETAAVDVSTEHQKGVPYVFLCDAYREEEIRSRGRLNAGLWKAISKNQDPRFHFFEEAEVGHPASGRLPALCLDFKKVFALSTDQLYQGLGKGVRRLAVVPHIYREHLIQRYGAFVSRVSLPD